MFVCDQRDYTSSKSPTLLYIPFLCMNSRNTTVTLCLWPKIFEGVLSQLCALQVSDGLTFSRKIVNFILMFDDFKCHLCEKLFKTEILKKNWTGPFDKHPLQLKWIQEQQELTMGIPLTSFIVKWLQCLNVISVTINLLRVSILLYIIFHYPCKSVQLTFYSSHLWTHKYSVHGGIILSSNRCDTTFKRRDIWTHKESFHWGNIFICKICDANFGFL